MLTAVAHAASPLRRTRSWLICCLILLAACATGDLPAASGVTAPPGFDVRVFATELRGPTQMVWAANGDLIVAELNGGENDAAGRIVRLSADDPGDRTVLQEGLDKPTGIAIAGDHLWIMERQRLSIAALAPGANRTTVMNNLPFNGRSEGTLTVTPDGRLLYDTSGSKRGPDRVEGSGTIFAIDDAAAGPSEPVAVATGFKHAYAHLVDDEGQLWSVEMSDGNFDDQRAADELLAVDSGDDAGWPQCVGDNRPVAEFGGTTELCSAAPRSHALFEPGSTPTSLVVAPWDPTVFVVTLWVPGQVVTVPRSEPGDVPHGPAIFIDGIESPQHLLIDGESLLVSDHETGQIFRVTSKSG